MNGVVTFKEFRSLVCSLGEYDDDFTNEALYVMYEHYYAHSPAEITNLDGFYAFTIFSSWGLYDSKDELLDQFACAGYPPKRMLEEIKAQYELVKIVMLDDGKFLIKYE